MITVSLWFTISFTTAVLIISDYSLPHLAQHNWKNCEHEARTSDVLMFSLMFSSLMLDCCFKYYFWRIKHSAVEKRSGRWREKWLFDSILPHHETGTRFQMWELSHASKPRQNVTSHKLNILLVRETVLLAHLMLEKLVCVLQWS